MSKDFAQKCVFAACIFKMPYHIIMFHEKIKKHGNIQMESFGHLEFSWIRLDGNGMMFPFVVVAHVCKLWLQRRCFLWVLVFTGCMSSIPLKQSDSVHV